MNRNDRKLGMHTPVTRRDILHGAGLLAAAAFVPTAGIANAKQSGMAAGAYPPALAGLRGNHPGSYDVAHQLAREGKTDWGPYADPDDGEYDLIVVGAGLSGLAAAHFYRQAMPAARILLLDNHDDFGGHAKRNEFVVDGRTLLGYGGAQTLEEPNGYNQPTKALLRDLGIDVERFETAYDYDFYRRHGLRAVTYFDEDNWPRSGLVDCDLAQIGTYIPFAPATTPLTESVQSMPMSAAAKQELLKLLTAKDDRLADMSLAEKYAYLQRISYRDFLQRHMGVTEPEVFTALQRLATDTGLGIDHASAAGAIFYVRMPGADAIGIPKERSDPYIHHFPDGNASVARLLVRAMIPGVAPGENMEDVVTAKFDYDKLDQPGADIRLRLNSTVVNVANVGDAKAPTGVAVRYVRAGEGFTVRGKRCVLACYNAMIPALCPDLPAAQREALAWQVKTPILYTTVALRNWRAWHKLGVGGIAFPGGYHANAMLDFPVSIGDYRFAANPDDPICVHMERFFYRPDAGLTKQEQHRVGRHELFAATFETIERAARQQLHDALADGGFDPARDIAAITANRWGHGYSYSYSGLDEPLYDSYEDERYPHVRGRKPFGRIAIANSDAGAGAVFDAAVGQAYRAVGDLLD